MNQNCRTRVGGQAKCCMALRYYCSLATSKKISGVIRMRILLELGHPAHVHFFAESIRRFRASGHELTIVTRDKEITNALLDRMGMPLECLSSPRAGKAALFQELAFRWYRVASIIRKRKIDVAASISGISTSFPARVCGIRNVTFTDTEDAKISNLIAFPFSDVILTPEFFLGNLGRKHHRYRGLHELAYLQRYDFERGREVRRKLGLPERYSIIRKVALDALHDTDVQGFTLPQLMSLVERLKAIGQVFITSQNPLPESLSAYRLSTPIEDIHAVLEGAQLFIGESPTMAVESSLLGTPAFLISNRVSRLGNMVGLESQHELLRNYESWEAMDQAIPALGDLPALKPAWATRAKEFRESCVDMASLIEGAILEGKYEPCVAS